jgi:ribosomal protein S8
MGSSPVFPITVVTNQYAYFLNQLRMGSAKRSISYSARVTRQTKPLAKLLLRLNIIRGIRRLEGQIYLLYPSYSRYRKGPRSFKTYSRVNGRIILTKKSIRLLQIMSPHSYYVLDTPKGLMTHKEAFNLGIGGMLLLIIY